MSETEIYKYSRDQLSHVRSTANIVVLKGGIVSTFGVLSPVGKSDKVLGGNHGRWLYQLVLVQTGKGDNRSQVACQLKCQDECS